jgi:micrococcal nuclease
VEKIGENMYEYRVKIIKVVDGDTVDVDIDLGFGVWLKNERVRLFGIDTPESRTRDKEEKKYGLAAKAFLKDHLKIGTPYLRTHKDGKGKFGRILGEFWVEEFNETHNVSAKTNLNVLMIEEHHAVAYHGQSKEEIAEQHIENRQYINV